MSKLYKIVVAFALFAGFSAQAEIAYHDTFDGDGLATNTGTGGDLEAKSHGGGNWAEAGNLSYDSAGAGDRAYASSLNCFDLSGGFTLTVKWTGTDSINGDSFGLSHTKITSTNADNEIGLDGTVSEDTGIEVVS